MLADEFNCLSRYSDAAPEDCGELRFAKSDDHALERQFKPPSLRDVAERAPYMHAGQFATLREVLEHYNRAPAAPAGHSELKPLNLSEQELGSAGGVPAQPERAAEHATGAACAARTVGRVPGLSPRHRQPVGSSRSGTALNTNHAGSPITLGITREG